ncbi:MAG: hypothetical protein AB1349_03270 [Elusimicrobiota bacterium]
MVKKILKKIRYLLLLIFIFSNSLSCIFPQNNEFGNKTSSKRVLIVSEKSRFSDPVISKVIGMLLKDGCYILLSNTKKLTDAKTQEFGAVILVNEVKPKQKSRRVKVFLSQQEQKKIILLNAVGNDYWKGSGGGGDSVGKQIDNSGKIANSLVTKVRQFLKKMGPEENH